MKIFKYDVAKPEEGQDITKVELPAGSKVLSAGVVNGKVRAYALVNVDAAPELHEFLVVKTGEDVPAGVEIDQWTYLSTLYRGDGKTWHVFWKAP